VRLGQGARFAIGDATVDIIVDDQILPFASLHQALRV
jgi:hypothetical protein